MVLNLLCQLKKCALFPILALTVLPPGILFFLSFPLSLFSQKSTCVKHLTFFPDYKSNSERSTMREILIKLRHQFANAAVHVKVLEGASYVNWILGTDPRAAQVLLQNLHFKLYSPTHATGCV